MTKRKKTEVELGDLLRGTGQTVSVAESCTGGRISHLITTVSGSSEYYLGSVTSYAVKVKEKILKVNPDTIKEYGVVSKEVAAAMAEGVRKITGSTYSVSTTGLAEGGDGHYPEGTVWIGVSGPDGTDTIIYRCNLGRTGNIRRFSAEALKILANHIRKCLEKEKQTSRCK